MKCTITRSYVGQLAFPQERARPATVNSRFRVKSGPRPVRRVLAKHPDLITDRSASRMCRVGQKTLYRWIATSLWPLPRMVCRRVFLFKRSDVEDWIATGEWPNEALFINIQYTNRSYILLEIIIIS
jgi:predicted DNA-binding transcriptional regulator AlpA